MAGRASPEPSTCARTGRPASRSASGSAPWARGRGVMSRAVRLALVWAFVTLHVDVAHWRAAVGNWGSRRVAWACGFRVEGTVRGLLEARGRRQDGWVGSLLAGEPMAPERPWLDAPPIHGRQVVLRPWADADIPRIIQASNDAVGPRSAVRSALAVRPAGG